MLTGRFVCARCQIFARGSRLAGNAIRQTRRAVSSESSSNPNEFEAALSTPSWSVRSLLPPSTEATDAPSITSKQLHHLLRLSALPAPSSPEEEAKMLKTLKSQLHFVKDVQSVDTAGVEPLRSIRDETPEGIRGAEIGMEELRHVFEGEEVVGPSRRIRKKRGDSSTGAARIEEEDWDVLGHAERKVGKYFVVETEKEKD
ncbi:MAG: translation elongation factor Tu [Chaenotheca gracillima]|nr:MAG: translation elongation factor Tu [Chaenotheca gracillima]